MTTPRTIRTLAELTATEPTVITEETNVLIPGCYIDWNGNGSDACAPGARYTLRDEQSDARVRDLVLG